MAEVRKTVAHEAFDACPEEGSLSVNTRLRQVRVASSPRDEGLPQIAEKDILQFLDLFLSYLYDLPKQIEKDRRAQAHRGSRTIRSELCAFVPAGRIPENGKGVVGSPAPLP